MGWSGGSQGWRWGLAVFTRTPPHFDPRHPLWWNGDEGDDGGPTAHAEAATVQYLTMGSTTLGCGGANNSVRTFVADTGSPLGVPNGTYTDTLTLLLAPNP